MKKYKNIMASCETEVQPDYEFDDVVEPPEGAKKRNCAHFGAFQRLQLKCDFGDLYGDWKTSRVRKKFGCGLSLIPALLELQPLKKRKNSFSTTNFVKLWVRFGKLPV